MTIKVLTTEELNGLDLVIDNGAVISASITTQDPTVGFNIVVLGDSNASAVPYTSAENRYSNLISQYTGLVVPNIGVPGDRTDYVLARLDTDLTPLKSTTKRNIVTLLVGTNDVAGSTPKTPEEAWVDMQALIAGILSRGWELIVYTYPPRTDAVITTRLKALNQFVLNNQNLGYTCVDLYPSFVDANDVMISSLFVTDGLHIASGGHTIVYNKTMDALYSLTNDTMFNIGIINYPPASDFNLNAIDFDGSTEYLANTTAQTYGIANTWTISVWFNMDTITADNTNLIVLRNFPTDLNNYRVIYLKNYSGYKLETIVYGSTGASNARIRSGGTTIATGTRYNVIVSWDGTSFVMTLNGSNETLTDRNTTGTVTQTDTNQKIWVGSERDGTSVFTDGKISKIDIWNSVLSSAEKTALYNSGNGYKLDTRNTFGNYTSTANLKHQWALGKDTGSNIGADYVASGGRNISTNSSGISDADIVTF